MKNPVVQLLVFLLLFVSVSPVLAQTNDWNTLLSQVNSEIAVKADKRKTVFGILTEADSSQIKVKTSKDGNVSEIVFKRSEIEKVWLANLRKGSRKTLLGAGIGAGVGAGVGFGASYLLLIATNGSDSGGSILAGGALIGAGVGAAIGGATGFFSRSGNKKERLIYQR